MFVCRSGWLAGCFVGKVLLPVGHFASREDGSIQTACLLDPTVKSFPEAASINHRLTKNSIPSDLFKMNFYILKALNQNLCLSWYVTSITN